MKVVLQVVKKASISLQDNHELIASINKGYLLFVGLGEEDNDDIVIKMAEKILKLRIFKDENGKTNLSLNDVGGEILSISQFTLYADAKEGNRPSFTKALKPIEAKRLYELFDAKLREKFIVKEGVFGEDMDISLCNDGPFTLILDSKELFR